MKEPLKLSRIPLFLQAILEKLSHPRLYYFLATCAMLIGVVSWAATQWKETFLFLQEPIPLWLVLLILCSLIAPALIVNRKNKSLQKELEHHNPKPDKVTLTFTSNESPKIEPGIQIQSEVKHNGLYSVSDDVVCIKHQRALRPDNHIKPYEYCCREHGCNVKIKTPLISFAKTEARDLTEAYIRKTFNVEPYTSGNIYG